MSRWRSWSIELAISAGESPGSVLRFQPGGNRGAAGRIGLYVAGGAAALRVELGERLGRRVGHRAVLADEDWEAQRRPGEDGCGDPGLPAVVRDQRDGLQPGGLGSGRMGGEGGRRGVVDRVRAADPGGVASGDERVSRARRPEPAARCRWRPRSSPRASRLLLRSRRGWPRSPSRSGAGRRSPRPRLRACGDPAWRGRRSAASRARSVAGGGGARRRTVPRTPPRPI